MARHHPAAQMAIAAIAISIAVSAQASTTADLAIRPGPLSRSLADLASQGGVEMLFDEDLVRGLRARAVRGRLTPQAALSLLLGESDLSFRRTEDGTFVIFRQTRKDVPEIDDGAIAEILVVGRRTLNVGVRRTENDIQAYKVSTSRDILASHRETVDGYVRSRIPANAETVSTNQSFLTLAGSTNSQVDLRGLGAHRTLVLIDGRRFPAMPSAFGTFDQGDLNGLPIGAIERIETLTSTAGGIEGAGAIGGVINVVLRRDYRGADFTVTSGISDRGDAGRIRIEGRLGFTPDGGDTDIMLMGSFAASQPFKAGQRDYARRARQQIFTYNPDNYLRPGGSLFSIPASNAIVVLSRSGQPLRFDREFGGASLNASYTYLPLNSVGSDADRLALLAANAGKIDLDPPKGPAGDDMTLLNNPTITSGLLSVRRRLGNHVEAYFDGLLFQNQGEARRASGVLSSTTSAAAPSNPFDQQVLFRFPSTMLTTSRTTSQMYRIVGGLLFDLSNDWRGTAEFAVGAAHVRTHEIGFLLNTTALVQALTSGTSPGAGLPPLLPLGTTSTFDSALSAYYTPQTSEILAANYFTNASFRIGGPVTRLPSGMMTLNLLAEQRREVMPSRLLSVTSSGGTSSVPTAYRAQTFRSAYAELRAPLVSPSDDIFLVRGLEASLAVRFDSGSNIFPESASIGDSNKNLVKEVRNSLMYTIGAKFFPLRWLMLRGSYATGEVPPTLRQLQSVSSTVTPGHSTLDPMRGNLRAGINETFTRLTGGAHDIEQEAGSTLSVGVVINPAGERGPRLSIDYSKIVARREIQPFPLFDTALLAVEASYPGRVVRGTLTDADRALGYTAGPILLIDLRNANTGRSVVEAVDFQFDWQIPNFLSGDLSPYARATWQPRAWRQASPAAAVIDQIGFRDQPLAWRGNAGLSWRKGTTSLDVNVQYFHDYKVTYTPDLGRNADLIASNGRLKIPAQAYVDLSASHRFNIASPSFMRAVEVRFGIQNLLDHSPPIIGDLQSSGYSTLGDPRRRRVELAVTSTF